MSSLRIESSLLDLAASPLVHGGWKPHRGRRERFGFGWTLRRTYRALGPLEIDSAPRRSGGENRPVATRADSDDASLESLQDDTALDGRDDDALFEDLQVAPNIVGDPATYELENEALQRDGRLDRALHAIAPWDDATLVDIGCGTGYWLPTYAQLASAVIGVEPDPRLVALATERVAGVDNVEVRHGSAEHLPVTSGSADVVHARFAYFFGSGAEAGLDEVRRVLAPGGTFIAIDNSWTGGDFARLLDAATTGNASIDPGATERWWTATGARRHEVEGAWAANSNEELDRILRIEFPADVVNEFMENHSGSTLSYRFALYEWPVG